MDDHVIFFKALSDTTRCKIAVLLSGGELCVCDIEASLGLPQAKVSRHLAVLRHSGIVRARRHGQWMYYSLVEPKTKMGKDIFRYFRKELLKNSYIKKGGCR